jgi:glycosyltransferase involved in cell wall biosynthesis
VANLIEYKGHRDLLLALALVRDRLPADWRLLCVGRNTGAGSLLKELTSTLDLEDHVWWVGEVREAGSFFFAADIALLCSHEEGFSNSLIEAMGHGAPVVATAVGGNLDAVIDGVTGLLVPTRAPEALGEAILKLALDPVLRARLGAAARCRVQDCFSLAACGQRYANLYAGVDQLRRGPVQAIINPPNETSSISVPRVIHVIPDLGYGGAEFMLTQMLGTRDRQVNEVMVVSLLPGGPLALKLRENGIIVLELNFGSVLGILTGLPKLSRFISNVEPDIVQGWMYYGDFVALVSLLLSGRRRTTKLAWGIRCSNMVLSLYRIRLRLVVRLCRMFSRAPDLVIANSRAGLTVHLAMGYRPRRHEVIENGVDIERFRPAPQVRTAIRKEFGIPDDAIVVAHVARVDPMKDHQTFFKAMEELPEYFAFVVGAGTEQIASTRSIHCLGIRTDTSSIFGAADFVVSSSAFGEGFSNVIAEGMACGLPAIATDVGDAVRIIGDTGLVVQPREPQALAAAIRRLASEAPVLRAERATRARARIAELFPLQRSVSRTEEVYSSLG